jgi:hypothetical protein
LLRFLVDMRGADVDDRQVNCESRALESFILWCLSSFMEQIIYISWLVTASG